MGESADIFSEAFCPSDEGELSDIIAEAGGAGEPDGSGGRKTHFRIIGGGSRLALGNPVSASAKLSLENISGVRLYEPEALTLIVAAGTPVEEVTALLEKNNQHLAFEPADYRAVLGTESATPRMGALVACNIAGPRRIAAGAARDALIGLRAVTGRGGIIKNGGRVMKNVTGYDLVKLLAGSYGSLAVLSELAFKTLPRPQSRASLCISGLADAAAMDCLCAALGSPYQITGAAHVPQGLGAQEIGAQGLGDTAPLTLMRIEGFEDSVRYRMGALRELIGKTIKGLKAEIWQTDAETSDTQWQAVRDLHPFVGKAGDIWHISAKPTEAAAIGKALQDLRGESEPACEYFYDWGGARTWALCPSGFDLRAALSLHAPQTGYATRLRGNDSKSGNAFPPLSPTIARIQAELRAKFDPHALLNPNIMND